jgi:adenylate cyclase
MDTAPCLGTLAVSLTRYGLRVAVGLVPVLFAILHATGILNLGLAQRLDDIIYDARLRATMPGTLDKRIVIVDVDEKSLAEIGRWPWPRDKMAALADEIFDRQKAVLTGFDMVFAEPDESSGLRRLRQMAQDELRDEPGFVEKVRQMETHLDHDDLFARSLHGRPVVLGYYFTSDRDGRNSGVLPEPVMAQGRLLHDQVRITTWNGFGANIAVLAKAAPQAGFFNAIADPDGVVRSTPLIAEYQGRFYESLGLAMFRRLTGMPTVEPGHPTGPLLFGPVSGIESILLKQDGRSLAIPVDKRVAALVSFRGPGGTKGGSYGYHSASDVLLGRLPPGLLNGKIVLVGTTAPGLLDLRATPVNEAYPGVEIHANMISGLLDGNLLVKPDYVEGFELVLLFLVGITLAFGLPALSATRAVALGSMVVGLVLALNFWLFLGYGLVLPMASALMLAVSVFGLNMSYGFFVESRSKRELANLFGNYVPPELVNEMLKDPDRYTMQATERELTVMFCDMRGFTHLSEQMDPIQLQSLLNTIFSRLTRIIRAQRGTVDKYMGDCIMAFWGAPVESGEHAAQAVRAALAMSREIIAINQEREVAGQRPIAIGIGLHTGFMCVGDMGSDVRRSYTVIGDAVNLGSRLEGLTKTYGVPIIASQATRDRASGFHWQELDRVRVNGRDQAVTIYCPLRPIESAENDGTINSCGESAWNDLLRSYRAQDWPQCEGALAYLLRQDPDNVLYHLYAHRVASRRRQPPDPGWDGTTDFETK